MLTLYDYLDSGNGYKARLLLAQLDRRYRRVELDIMAGQTRAPEFLAKNPNGRIPSAWRHGDALEDQPVPRRRPLHHR